MSVGSSAAGYEYDFDLDLFERDIDLRVWWQALLSRLWVVTAGLLVGLVLGGLSTLGGSASYQATVAIDPAQPFTTGGSPVLSYASSPLAVQLLATTPGALRSAAAAAHMPIGELRGRVTTSSFSTVLPGPVVQRGTILIEVTVTLPQAERAQLAANALGAYIIRDTEGKFIKGSLLILARRDATWTQRLDSADRQINQYNNVLAETSIGWFHRVQLINQLDLAVQRQANLENDLTANEQAVVLTKNIELARVLNPAAAERVSGGSRLTALLLGAVLGLILGGIAALVLGLRRAKPAADTPRAEPA